MNFILINWKSRNVWVHFNVKSVVDLQNFNSKIFFLQSHYATIAEIPNLTLKQGLREAEAETTQFFSNCKVYLYSILGFNVPEPVSSVFFKEVMQIRINLMFQKH